MLFGVILSFWKHKYLKKFIKKRFLIFFPSTSYFNDKVSILCEFVPQIIFLMAIFGYMNLIIIAKWITLDSNDAACAPSILIILINMFLYKYPEEPCNVAPMYYGQQAIQTLLLFVALICVPWMLCLKPFILKKQHDQKVFLAKATAQQFPSGASKDDGDFAVQIEQGIQQIEDLDMGDIIIHQSIHTIEYCLGAISNTASYLRLWALSLAHAQLSEVLWNMVMRIGLTGKGVPGGLIMYFVFTFWATLTVGVLLLMEGLSAFLHALRLHWVEFQNKFYTGNGYIFQPFSFEIILLAAETEEA